MLIGLILVAYFGGLVWICVNSLFMPRLKYGPHSLPLVSICVPLRNEEQRIRSLIGNLKQMQYERFEVLLYDDESDDRTLEFAYKVIAGDTRFQVLEGGMLPAGWKGKSHACYQLVEASKGKFILFIDADVQLDVHTVDACVATMERMKCDALSGFPRFIAMSYLEKLLTPLLHFFVYMHLPIHLANTQVMPSASAASGAFLCVKRDSYLRSGGHQLVKDAVVEDVTLFRELKVRGYKAMIFHVADYVHCEMYDSSKAAWNGFSKNVFAGFNYSYLVGGGVFIFYVSYYMSPAFLVVFGLMSLKPIYFIPYICVSLQRVVSDVQSRQLSKFTLFMPLSAAFYCLLLLTAMWRRLWKRESVWKGRAV